jgi:hypothetical protein
MDNLKRTTIVYRILKELISPVHVAPVADLLACAIVVPATAVIVGWGLKYVAVGLPYFGAAVGVIYFVAAIVKLSRRLFNVGH